MRGRQAIQPGSTGKTHQDELECEHGGRGSRPETIFKLWLMCWWPESLRLGLGAQLMPSLSLRPLDICGVQCDCVVSPYSVLDLPVLGPTTSYRTSTTLLTTVLSSTSTPVMEYSSMPFVHPSHSPRLPCCLLRAGPAEPPPAELAPSFRHFPAALHSVVSSAHAGCATPTPT